MSDIEIDWAASSDEVEEAVQILSATASKHDLAISEEHLAELAEAYHSYPYLRADNVFPSSDHYKTTPAGRGLVVKMSRLQSGIPTADVHFLSKKDTATSEAIMLQAITSLWSYLLLCESGVIRPPVRLHGITNKSMATFAHKVGFKATIPQPPDMRTGHMAIRVRYDTLLERAFAPRIQRIATRLGSLTNS